MARRRQDYAGDANPEICNTPFALSKAVGRRRRVKRVPMNLIDISWPISQNMTAYKDKKVVAIEHTKTFKQDNVRETMLHLGSHTGTHVDAPAHFLENGKSIDQIPLDMFIGSCTVLDLTNVEERIVLEDLEQETIEKDSIVLFKTRNSFLSPEAAFNASFIYLTLSGAQYLVKKRVKAVGVDYLGIERSQPNHETHTELLRNNVGIIEGLRLQGVEPGNYTLWCLPLNVVGIEAAPARAVLVP